MELLVDPHAWLSLSMLAALEIVLGIDNIIFLAILVDRLPTAQRASARILGLGFAMATRIALLYSVTWLAALHAPWFTVSGHAVTGRASVLFGGGVFLIIQSVREIREVLGGGRTRRGRTFLSGFWMVIAQVGVIDIVFSLDSVFTAVGLANRIEIMIAAIVVSVGVMMVVSGAVSRFIDRRPTIKILSLAFLVLVGGALIAESIDRDIPQGYLFFAMAFSAAVEWLNLHLRR